LANLNSWAQAFCGICPFYIGAAKPVEYQHFLTTKTAEWPLLLWFKSYWNVNPACQSYHFLAMKLRTVNGTQEKLCSSCKQWNHLLISPQAGKATKAQRAGFIANASPATPSDIAHVELPACAERRMLMKALLARRWS
jgi:hypothetical protein